VVHLVTVVIGASAPSVSSRRHWRYAHADHRSARLMDGV